jgi:alkaline phosphatase D
VKMFLFFILFTISSCSQLPSKRKDKLSILQGVTNSKEVEFSVVTNKGRILRFELRSLEGEILVPDETKIVSRDESDYVIHKAVFIRDQHKDFNLYVYENEKIIDQRLVGHGQREVSRLRLAVVSCMNDFYSKYFKIWNELAKKNPEYLLMIGDNVYADASSMTTSQVTDPEILWKRYVDARLSLPIYFEEKLIPTHGLWDDHDYGINDGGSDYHHKTASKEIFEAFFAQDLTDDDWTKGFGVGGLLSLGDFNLYFLDARSFRSKNKEGTHLGLDQTAWFYSKLREETTPSLIIKGDQFFGGYHQFESFEGNHPNDFQQFVTELKQVTTPFVFISGDRHMSEIMQFPRSLFGKPSFEITSSPMHSKTFDNADKNPWRVVSQTDKVNFVIIDNVAKDNHWFLDVESIGEHGEVYFKRELAVYIKDLQNNLNEMRKRRSGKRRYRKLRSRRGRR